MNSETPPNDVWYYAQDGSSIGPFTQAELLQKVADGTLTPETFMIREGDIDWQPFSSIDAFKAGKRIKERTTPVQEAAASAVKTADGAGDFQRALSKKEIAGGLIFAFCLILVFCFWELRGARNENGGNAGIAEKGASAGFKQKEKAPYPFTVKEARDYFEMTKKARAGMEELLSSMATKDEVERAQIDPLPLRDKRSKVRALLQDIRVLFGHDDRLANVGTFRGELVESLYALNQAVLLLEELRKARTSEAMRTSIHFFYVSMQHCDEALRKAEVVVVLTEMGQPAPPL